MRTLYVVTHTEATHHAEHRVGGWFDSCLTDAGVGAAVRLSEALREQIPDGAPVKVFSSDLRRAVQTCTPIADAFAVRPTLLRGLREISYGEAEGRPQAWLDQRFTPPPRTGDRLNHDCGVAGAETRRAFGERVYSAVEHVLGEAGERTVLVTHGFALTFVVACWIGMPLDSAGHINVRSSSGGITELVEDDHFHNRQIARANDVSHLR